MGCQPCKEEESMHFKQNYSTPKKRISKLEGVNREPSFVENTPEPTKDAEVTKDG